MFDGEGKGRRCNTNSDIGGLVVDKLSPDELKISWLKMAWTANDWIGMFRPHSVAPALHIARFTVKGRPKEHKLKERIDVKGEGKRKRLLILLFLLSDHTQSLNVKMYPVPYGDLVLRYFRSEENVANSDTFSFGMPLFTYFLLSFAAPHLPSPPSPLLVFSLNLV